MIMCVIFLIGCKTQEAPTSLPIRQHSVSIVYQVDTIEGQRCLYKTMNYQNSIQVGEGSIVTKCGCLLVNEEVNIACITSQ
jgi:hypothetical protein